MMYSCILFDLDGTLLDSKQGVWHSFEYALKQLGYPNPIIDEAAIEALIGPPIEIVLQESFGYSLEESLRGYDYYQDEYVTHGRMLKDPFFEGVKESIDKLKAMGLAIGVCTNKGESTAREIIAASDLKIDPQQVYGPNGERKEKVDVIRDFLFDNGYKSDKDKKKVLMVGDRYYDIEGAKAAGIEGVGVSWGNGTEEELLAAGALIVIHQMEALCHFVK